MNTVHSCPNCTHGTMQVFHELKMVPTNSCILLSTRDEALAYPKGNISLGLCQHCGFISNVDFDPKLTEYSGRYEETQGFSDTFNQFHKMLAQRLIDKYQLTHKNIIEIGCGKGEFLVLLCEMGPNTGVGFDPGFSEERISPELKNITFIKDFYSEKYAEYHGDFLCCKMTLEHIPNTSEFITTIRRSIANQMDTTVFFQIPNAERIIKTSAFEDIFYEHCSYFTKASLSFLFIHSGFDVLDVTTEYDDQYLTIEAKPSPNSLGINHCTGFDATKDIEGLQEDISRFKRQLDEKHHYWTSMLATHHQSRKKVVIWGSGSKAEAFLTSLQISEEIGLVVDINPYKNGYYMAGTGHKIVLPSSLIDYQPDTVIIMNAIYKTEISNTLAQLNLTPELLTL